MSPEPGAAIIKKFRDRESALLRCECEEQKTFTSEEVASTEQANERNEW
jgi:hypothetical protein